MRKLLLILFLFFTGINSLYSYTYERPAIGIYHSNITYRPYIYDIVQGSPAEKAGLQKGDLIIEVNGKKVFNYEGRFINGKKGDKVEIKVLRGLDGYTYNLKLDNVVFSHDYGYIEKTIKETDFTFIRDLSYEHIYSIDNFNENYEYYLLLKINNGNGLLFNEFFDEDAYLDKDIKAKRIYNKDFRIEARDLSKNYLGEKNIFTGFMVIKIDDKYYFDSISRVGGYFDFTGNKKMLLIKAIIKDKYYQENNFKEKVRIILEGYKNKVGLDQYYAKTNELILILEKKRHEIIGDIKTKQDLAENAGILQKIIDIEDILLEPTNKVLNDVIQNLIKPLE